ncbi:propionyl-CoA carboxylase [Trinickia symbiotica]|uniref:Propionyl-CoA carboxylase n=1 Tax=Trinickia symbiotica TaxID=863227 RepID=A0A2T3XLK0_9BURK|nr:carboxyl transferase domain-containing protein [Trinickia symbiotica]PTB17396.1 propionyl-CoA carboxylase [Trinickia symbiotica]
MQVSQQRINMLFDDGSFVDHHPDTKGHFICGEGMIHSVKTFLVMNRGRDCEFHGNGQWQTARQIISTITRALGTVSPLIYIQDKPGEPGSTFDTTKVLSPDMSRLLLSPLGMGRVSASLAQLAERNLLISAILGPTSGPLALPLMLADIVLMTERGALCMGRPDMVKAMLAQESELYSLGGSAVHSKQSGLVQLVFSSEETLLGHIRRLLHFIFNDETHGNLKYECPDTTDFENLVPSNHYSPYDIHHLLHSFIDRDSLTEISPEYAREVLTGIVSIKGKTCAVIANNPRHNGGIIYRKSASKMAKMINIAAKTGVPIIFIADVPGFMIGKDAENSGIFSAAAELFSSHIRCKTPKLLLVARKAYTGGVYAMCGPGFDPVAILAYPQAHIGVFSPETMNKIMSDSNETSRHTIQKLTDEIKDPRLLKEMGLITDIIEIECTREQIVRYLFPACEGGGPR